MKGETEVPGARYERPSIDELVSSVNSSNCIINLKLNQRGRQANAHCYLYLLFGKKLKSLLCMYVMP
jgi:hypothetical protein